MRVSTNFAFIAVFIQLELSLAHAYAGYEVLAREALPQGPGPAPPGRERPPGRPGPPNPPGQRQPDPTTTSASTRSSETTTSTSSRVATTSYVVEPTSSATRFSSQTTISTQSVFPTLLITTTFIPITPTFTPSTLTTLTSISTLPIITSSLGDATFTTYPTLTSGIASTGPLNTTPYKIPSMSTATPTTSPSLDGGMRSQNILVIVLSVVLGSVALLLGSLAIFLISRCKRRRSFRRGVTPINDAEIESWRGAEKKLSLSVRTRSIEPIRTNTLLPLSPDSEHSPAHTPFSPDWAYGWSAADSIQSPPPARSRGPSLVATAPNARIGLTTDTVPGAMPYVPVLKRQSSRLSRERNHARSKSMRSSASSRSMRSLRGESVSGFDFTADHEEAMRWFPYEHKDIADVSTLGGTNSPGTSIYGGAPIAALSPRPRPLPMEILSPVTALSPRPEQRNLTSTRNPESPSDWPKSWR